MRSLSLFEGGVDFYSNDYLGWGQTEFAHQGNVGATGSRLISGNSKEAESAEREIARFFQAEAALMFNSGYDANVGVFSSIPQKGDVVIYDAHIHASVRDGLRMGVATSYSFQHNDLQHLEARLQVPRSGVAYVAVESIYSMLGDIAPLEGIEALCTAYNAYLIVDEAHACGVFGEAGKGLFQPEFPDRCLRLVTFGKAYGSHGAAVLASLDFRTYLINFARAFIYTTALPSYVFTHNAAIISHTENDRRRAALKAKIAHFRSVFSSVEMPSDVQSPIQIVPMPSVEGTKKLALRLQKAGISVKPIFSPTVPEGQECLRICLHAFNSREEIDRLVSVLTA